MSDAALHSKVLPLRHVIAFVLGPVRTFAWILFSVQILLMLLGNMPRDAIGMLVFSSTVAVIVILLAFRYSIEGVKDLLIRQYLKDAHDAWEKGKLIKYRRLVANAARLGSTAARDFLRAHPLSIVRSDLIKLFSVGAVIGYVVIFATDLNSPLIIVFLIMCGVMFVAMLFRVIEIYIRRFFALRQAGAQVRLQVKAIREGSAPPPPRSPQTDAIVDTIRE